MTIVLTDEENRLVKWSATWLEKKPCPTKKKRTPLTPTGLLMEGHYTFSTWSLSVTMSGMATLQQLSA
jgi:hypothetical protein